MTSPTSQAVLFVRLRWRLLRNASAQAFFHSRVRLFSILAASGIVWAVLFAGALGL